MVRKRLATSDLTFDYWKVESHPGDQYITALTLLSSIYVFQTKPFVLTGAHSTFQWLIHTKPAGLVYLGDVMTHKTTIKGHIKFSNSFKLP